MFIINTPSITLNSINPNFQAGKATKLNYIVHKLPDKLPERVLAEARKACENSKETLPTLQELHDKIYKPLMRAKTLQEAKEIYPEFNDVLELSELKVDKRNKSVVEIKNAGHYENFTLNLLKGLYSPKCLEELGKSLGGLKRKALEHMIEKLNIIKLSSHYQRLYALSNPEENTRYAKQVSGPMNKKEAKEKALKNSIATHKSEAYRAKKSREIKDYISRTNNSRKDFINISKVAWKNSPDIKLAMSKYRQKQSNTVKGILIKEYNGEELSKKDSIIFTSFFKGFWQEHPELKTLFKERVKKAKDELKK